MDSSGQEQGAASVAAEDPWQDKDPWQATATAVGSRGAVADQGVPSAKPQPLRPKPPPTAVDSRGAVAEQVTRGRKKALRRELRHGQLLRHSYLGQNSHPSHDSGAGRRRGGESRDTASS